MSDLLNLISGDAGTRRAAIKLGLATAGGLIVSCKTPSAGSGLKDAGSDAGGNAPWAYLQITPDGQVKFVTTRAESGQGISAGLSVLVAEELDIPPESIQVLYAGINNLIPKLSDDEMGATGGSSSIREFYQPVRIMAAQARDMLIAAGAAKLGVAAGQCSVQDGKVVSGAQSVTFGQVAQAAAAQPIPSSPALKQPADYKYIGKGNRRQDVTAKITGAAVFGIDVNPPGLLVGAIVHCPYVSGDVQSVDDSQAKTMAGYLATVKCPYGVILVADSYYHALAASKKLNIQWSQKSTVSSDAILAQQKQLVQSPAMVAAKNGDANGAMGTAAKQVNAEYVSQYLPHMTLEPQNCTAVVNADGSCEIWAPTQDPASAAALAAGLLGVDASKVKVNTTLLGGGFGRRLRQDYVGEAVYAAKAVPGKPVKVIWSRGEDYMHDFYRPSSYAKMQAGLGADGKPIAWLTRLACSSIYSWLDEQPSNLISPKQRTDNDSSSTEGADELPYAVANFQCEWAQYEPGVPVSWWRSVGHSQNAFFVESFIDECAHAAGVDPMDYRMGLITDARTKAVLQLAKDKSGWTTPPAQGVGRGVAIHSAFGSIVAEVVEVSVQSNTIFVQKVTVAIDCGTAVDAQLVHTQMESAIAQALGATIKQAITFANGRAVQSNFNSCQPLMMSEMPAVDTNIVPSTDKPGGIGEPGVPPLAPAVANAVFAATGKRLRNLPLKMSDG